MCLAQQKVQNNSLVPLSHPHTATHTHTASHINTTIHTTIYIVINTHTEPYTYICTYIKSKQAGEKGERRQREGGGSQRGI